MRPPAAEAAEDRARVIFSRHATHGELSRAALVQAVRSDKELQSLLRIGVSGSSSGSFASVFAGMDVDDSDLVDEGEFVRFIVQHQHPHQLVGSIKLKQRARPSPHPDPVQHVTRAGGTPPRGRMRRTSSWKRPPPLPLQSRTFEQLERPPGISSSSDEAAPPPFTSTTPSAPRSVSFGNTFSGGGLDGEDVAHTDSNTKEQQQRSVCPRTTFRKSGGSDGDRSGRREDSSQPRARVSFCPPPLPTPSEVAQREQEQEQEQEEEEEEDGWGTYSIKQMPAKQESEAAAAAAAESEEDEMQEEDEHTALLRFLSGDSSALLRASSATELINRANHLPQDFDELMQPGVQATMH